jgi:uncharacterized membrane protein
MKNLAFVVALLILALGVVGVLMPSGLVWVAQHSVTPGAFYLIAAVRVLFGLVLISVAAATRAPKALRILGYIIVFAGIATALAGLLAIERVQAFIDWWVAQGSWLVRLSAVPVLALGGFVAYACAPARRG